MLFIPAVRPACVICIVRSIDASCDAADQEYPVLMRCNGTRTLPVIPTVVPPEGRFGSRMRAGHAVRHILAAHARVAYYDDRS